MIFFTESSIALMIVGLVGRLCISGVFSVVILHTSELFPTLNRNSAIGSSSTMAHVGSIAAPYIVDLLVRYNYNQLENYFNNFPVNLFLRVRWPGSFQQRYVELLLWLPGFWCYYFLRRKGKLSAIHQKK